MKLLLVLVAAFAICSVTESRVLENKFFVGIDSAVKLFEKSFLSNFVTDDTTIDPEETTVDPETTVEPEETTTGGEETTVDPEETTTGGEETTVDPEETTTGGEETTVDPEETTTNDPDATTTEPEETTSSLPTTTDPVETTTGGDSRRFPIFERSCEERKAELRASVKTSFNVAAYSGMWFEIERYQQSDENEADCLESFYGWNFIRQRFTIIRTGYDFLAQEIFDRQAHGFLSFPSDSLRLGLLNVTYNIVDGEADSINYYVLGTDYFQYAVGWACEDFEEDGEERSREFAWILSRTPQLPDDPELLARIETYVDRFLDRSFIRWTEQRDQYCLDRVSPGERSLLK